MARIQWLDFAHDLRRLVLSRDLDGTSRDEFRAAAGRLRLAVAAEDAEPRPGDFWVACGPRSGWAATDPAEVGVARAFEVPLVLAQLRSAVARDEDLAEVGRPVLVAGY